jgi:hypothetical protein
LYKCRQNIQGCLVQRQFIATPSVFTLSNCKPLTGTKNTIQREERLREKEKEGVNIEQLTVCQVKGGAGWSQKKDGSKQTKFVKNVLFTGTTTAVDRSFSRVFLWPESDLN